MKIKKFLALALAALMVVALFAGCGDSGSTNDGGTATSAPTATPASNNDGNGSNDNSGAATGNDNNTSDEPKGKVKIGHLLDLTGNEAATGNQAKSAFDFAAEHIGLMGGYEVEVVERDCQSNSGLAANAAAELVEQEGVIAIFGPTQIGHKSAVAGYLQDSGVPLILYNGTPAGMLRSSQWVVGEGGSTAPFPTVMADYAYNEMGYRKVYTIRQQTTGGDNYVLPFEENFTALGGEIIQSVELPVSGSDYSSLLATFTDPDADAIVGWTSSTDAVNFWSSWYELGLHERLPVLATMHGGFTDFYIMRQLDNSNPAIVEAILADETMTAINWCYSIDNEPNTAFIELWKSEHDGAVPGGNNLPGACWQALQMLQEAMNATGGDTDPETLLNAILETNFTGPEGHVFFASGERAASKDVNVAKVVRLDDGSYNYQVVKTYPDIGVTGYEG